MNSVEAAGSSGHTIWAHQDDTLAGVPHCRDFALRSRFPSALSRLCLDARRAEPGGGDVGFATVGGREAVSALLHGAADSRVAPRGSIAGLGDDLADAGPSDARDDLLGHGR